MAEKRAPSARGQTSVETLIIFAVALVLLGVIAGLVFDQLGVYYSQQQQRIAFNAVNSLANEVNDAYFISPGTVKTVLIDLPESADLANSYISGREILLRVNGSDVVANTKVDVIGDWPGKSGAYTVLIRAMEGYVIISMQSLEFYPANITEIIPETSSKDFNLYVTNTSDYSATYDYSAELSGPKLSVSSAPDFGQVTILSGETRRLDLNFSCAAGSMGQYFGGVTFAGDYNLTVPISISCISGQKKLSIFPPMMAMAIAANTKNSDSVFVCNSSSNDYPSSSASISGKISKYVFTSFSGPILANSCRQLDLNISSSSLLGSFPGKLRVTSGGSSDEADISLQVTAQ